MILLGETSVSGLRRFSQLGLYLFCLFSMFLLFTQLLFFPFLSGPCLQISPNFHKERNCFQVRIKQTRSLEKIKNNEFLSVGLLAHRSLVLPPFISLQKKENKSLLIPVEPCLQINLQCMLKMADFMASDSMKTD